MSIVGFLGIINLFKKGIDLYKLSLMVIFFSLTGNYYNGIDWINYQELHNELSVNGINYQMFYFYEPLYIYYDYILSKLSSDYYIVTFVSSSIGVLSLSYALKKNSYLIESKSFFLSLIFIGIYVSLYGEQVRQGIAFAILLPFLMNIKNVKIWLYIPIVIIAYLFHSSAIFAFLLYFIPRKKISIKMFVLIFIILVSSVLLVFNIDFLLPYVPFMLARKIEMYMSNKTEVGLGLFVLLDMAFIFYILCNYDNYDDYSLINFVLFYFISHVVFYMFPFLRRLSLYLLPFVFIYVTNVLMRKRLSETLANVICFLFAIYYFILPIKLFKSPYSRADLYEPKSFYFLPFIENKIDIDNLRYKKCYEINKVDQDFCRGL